MRLRVLSRYGDLRHVPPLAGLRRFGVPPGGPADLESATLAAALVGSPLERVVELAFGEATFAVEVAGTLAIVGAGRAERVPLAAGETIVLAPRGGARLALAATGGWAAPSLGADPETSFAVFAGGTLESPLRPVSSARRFYVAPPSEGPVELRVVAGPQRALWAEPLGPGADPFTVTPLLDRRGVRVSGAPQHPHEIPSEPCVPGMIQWTPGGELIVLGPEGPTIGGYPKPFAVIEADLPKVGRLLPDQRLRLVEIGVEEAERARRAAEVDLARRTLFARLAN